MPTKKIFIKNWGPGFKLTSLSLVNGPQISLYSTTNYADKRIITGINELRLIHACGETFLDISNQAALVLFSGLKRPIRLSA